MLFVRRLFLILYLNRKEYKVQKLQQNMILITVKLLIKCFVTTILSVLKLFACYCYNLKKASKRSKARLLRSC